MTQLNDKQIYLQVKRDSTMGFKQRASNNISLPSNSPPPMKKGELPLEEMIVMENYAQYLPRGNRKLKLNIKELTDAVLAKDLVAAPLTKTSGLNRGGMISLTTGQPKSQKEYLMTIQNKNALKTNPNYSSFKNDFKI